MKKHFLLAIIFILCILTVSAADYDVEITPIKDSIFLEESAEFEIAIKNNLMTIQNFRIYSSEVEWDIPSTDIKVYPDSVASERLVITPTKYVGPGMYGVALTIKDIDADETTEELIYIHIKPPGQAVSEYLPSVKMSYEMNEQIAPEEPVTIKITLENRNVLNLTDLAIKITSDLAVFNTEQPVQLKPLETKDIELSYDLDPLQAPGEYKLNFDLLKSGKTIDRPQSQIIIIGEKTLGFEEDVKKESVFFKTVIEATYSSKSNIKDVQEVRIPVSFIKNLFTETNPESTVIKEEDGQRFLLIDLELEPGQTKTVYITTNYRIIVYIAAALIIIAAIAYITRSPVKIRKGISEVKTEEGGISSLKIMLQVTSLVKKPIKGVIVADYIPSIAELQREFIAGTLKPTKILKSEKKGTILHWDLGELGPNEDRLISYNIKSKLSILGDFRLPRAKVLLRVKGKEKHIYSNSLGVEV
ncbi:hypothetical protein KY343_00390 [Candidatus Woesearchaeota archaeon]|nr:hypothetical protein [Candidatus Woesearchaeota archaeon]